MSAGAVATTTRVGARTPAAHAARLSAPATLLCCALAYAGFSQGAFYRAPFLTFAALLAAAAIVAVRRAGSLAALRGVPAVLGLAAAWAAVSGLLAGNVRGAAGPVLLAAALAAAFVVGRLTGADERDYVVSAVVAVGCCLAVLGWVGVVLRAVPLALPDQQLWRAASTITYSNGTAGLLAPVALLALARLTVRRDARATVAAALLVTGVAATLSRAGYLALGAGLVVLIVRNGARRTAAATWPVFAGALIAVAGLLPGMPATAPARPWHAVAGLAAGLVVAATGGRLPARQVVAGALAAVVLALAFGAGPPVADAARDVAGRRVTAASPDRAGEWSTAWRAARTSPLTGVGPGNLRLVWTHADGRTMRAHFTHNEYLEVLAEQGAAGLALALAVVATAARQLRRTPAERRRDRSASGDPGNPGDPNAGHDYDDRTARTARPRWLLAGAPAALAALVVHSAFDSSGTSR